MKKTEYVVLRTFLFALFIGLLSLVWLNLSHKKSDRTEHALVEDKTADAWTGHPQCMTGDSLVLKDTNSGEYVCRHNSKKLDEMPNS